MDEENDIDLGENPQEGAQPIEPNENYPTVSLSGGPELMKLPDSGKSTIHHRVISRSVPHGHDKKHRVTMELKSIKPHKARKSSTTKLGGMEQDAAAMRNALSQAD